MKLFRKSFIMSFLLTTCCTLGALLYSAFRGPEAKENKNKASASFVSLRPIETEKYVIDKKESVITWKGSRLFSPENGHTGFVDIVKGELMIERGQLVGGAVEVDMNTITDERHQRDNNLVEHLKSPDFFEVEKFPISTFAITGVASAKGEHVEVTGNLTIKGTTHAVTFPAQIEVKDGIAHANGKVIIDRTKWDVRYNSGKFYDNLADETISDDIEFHMKIVAKK